MPKVTFVIDAALLQKELILGTAGPFTYSKGSATFHHEVNNVDCCEVKESDLLNVALIKATLNDARATQLVEIVWVTEVFKRDGKLMRRLTDPYTAETAQIDSMAL